ncbi:dehydrogenase [Nocardioides sp. Root190]|uniref:FAD-dependent oxidoreductase n=1 Tax=Nocardioides sp. Root190 TaxID=1736488 RepID=UPI0006F37C1A|nr:FAD-dependent oxidoreductase [Nocardioides sp. Root190]KRB76277.1 dehydrogenase [Nocardioides sp. Root190]
MNSSTPRRIAVVGSGVAGLTAAYVASHPDHDVHVTLIEADDRLGGHADTHDVLDPTGRMLAIDTGFIVHNRRTYPVLLRIFDELGVPTQESEMSMSISDEQTGLEWAGALGRTGVFPAGERNHRNPSYLRMLTEIPRFHRQARRLLEATEDPAGDPTTLADFLDEGGFTPYFRRHFMEPLVAAVWSCEPETALEYPAAYLFSFLSHHGMLQVFGSPTWRTVTGGSRTYVRALTDAIRERGSEIRTGSPVLGIEETEDGVEVTTASGREQYDAVVIAAHPEQALGMLVAPTLLQKELLGAMPYAPNTALLHTDTSLLPSAEDARASWNFRRPASSRAGVLVTYDLTRLQRLPTGTSYLVTLGGEDLVDPDTVIARRDYAHPLYTPASVAAQGRLKEIDTDRIAFAGAYHGWGFHEDGARSGLKAAERLGLGWADGTPSAPAAPATSYRTTLTHRRRAPLRNDFVIHSHLAVVDLDQVSGEGTVDGARGRFLGRDHFDGDTTTVREGLDRFLAGHGIDLRGGRALMAAQPRAFGHCFNPISVHWCWTGSTGAGRPAATVVEVHNTYGDRHAYLLDADEDGRGQVDKAMYVSPFHGTDGHYEVVAPPPDPVSGRLRIAVRLVTEDGARFDAAVTGTPAPAPRLPLAGLRGSALIRAHGIALWARRLPVQPRPTPASAHQEGSNR